MASWKAPFEITAGALCALPITARNWIKSGIYSHRQLTCRAVTRRARAHGARLTRRALGARLSCHPERPYLKSQRRWPCARSSKQQEVGLNPVHSQRQLTCRAVTRRARMARASRGARWAHACHVIMKGPIWNHSGRLVRAPQKSKKLD